LRIRVWKGNMAMEGNLIGGGGWGGQSKNCRVDAGQWKGPNLISELNNTRRGRFRSKSTS